MRGVGETNRCGVGFVKKLPGIYVCVCAIVDGGKKKRRWERLPSSQPLLTIAIPSSDCTLSTDPAQARAVSLLPAYWLVGSAFVFSFENVCSIFWSSV